MEQNNSLQEQLKIEPFTLFFDIIKHWWVIILGGIAAMLLTYVVMSERYVPQYSTSATFVVSARNESNAYSNLSSTNKMAKTFQMTIDSHIMKKKMKDILGDQSFNGKIETTVLEGTNMLVLTVREDSPKEAIDLIRTIMDNYTSISYYTMGDTVMDVLAQPKVPVYPDNPLNLSDSMKKGFIIGAFIVIVLFGLLSYMQDTIKREDDIEEKLDARRLCSIIYEYKYKTLPELIKHRKKALLVNDPLAGFSFVENFKKLATKVDYQMSKEGRKVLVISSVSENEGKSTIASNLAISLAQIGKRVLLIDGDLRRPSQFLIFNCEPEEKNELGEFLKGRGKIEDVVLNSRIPNLHLAVGRNCYATSTEIVHTQAMKDFLDHCRNCMDYVLIDSPPAGLMGDAEAIAGYSDAVLLVVKQNFIMAEDINEVLDAFREHHSKVLGVVLNGVRSIEATPVGHFYGAYGRYGAYRNYHKKER